MEKEREGPARLGFLGLSICSFFPLGGAAAWVVAGERTQLNTQLVGVISVGWKAAARELQRWMVATQTSLD